MKANRPDNIETRKSLIAGADGPELRAVGLTETTEPGVDIQITTWWTVDDRGTFFIPGSFKKTLKERAADAPILYAHDFYSEVPIGITDERNTAETDTGVTVRGLINEGVPLAADVMSHLRFAKEHGKRGLGASFGFDTIRQRSAMKGDPLDFSVAPDWASRVPIEELYGKQEVRYWEASLLVFGSNAKAGPVAVRAMSTADLRSLLAALKQNEIEPDQRAILADIVAVWNAPAGAGESHATGDTQTRRNLEAEMQYAFLDLPDDVRAGVLSA